MATVVPIRWQGATRVKDLRAIVAAQTLAWLQNWAATPTSLASIVECLLPDCHSSGEGVDVWLSASGAHGTLWWRMAPGGLEEIGRCLVGTGVTEELGIAAGIGLRALKDLSAQWACADGAGELRVVSPPEAAALDPRHGAAGFSWALGETSVELHFDPGLCDSMLPSALEPAVLTSRAEAIGPAQLTLEAVLDLGMASLQDTLVLRPGEVIRTAVPLNQPVRVQTGSGNSVFFGELVADGDRRALRFISHQ
ncbi:MAG: FliM/FliN family flagellar motor C-terminal domain-containing protein [Pseudomonadota bacterium]|nr:FliM/FliN family flagellar motor C-terminal domain-containing protein [Pseudomonadota bacterium]